MREDLTDRPHRGERAFNAEAWLAEHFNAYLADPNEYRAIARNLLHLGGHVDYTTTARYSKGPTDGYPTPAVADHQSQHSRFRHSVQRGVVHLRKLRHPN